MPSQRQRFSALVGTAVFLVVGPGTVAGLVPWWISRWHMQAPLWHIPVLKGVGILLMAAGVPVILDSFARFALQGLGTPVPIAPTRHLIVTGLYRHVRNPIYIAVVALILGQGLLLGDLRLLLYGLVIWLAFHLFVRLYEEPTLSAAHGAEYETFRVNVPRWIPRLRPWRRR